MSEHQLMPVAGYTPQSQAQIDAVNRHKQLEEQVLRAIEAAVQTADFCDLRWAAIAKTNIEQGFMALNRAIFQPQRVDLP